LLVGLLATAAVSEGRAGGFLDEMGPGVITHVWLTFLGPEPQDWAKQGSANHQEMLLRVHWIELKKMSRKTPCFHAQYRQEYPVEQGKDYVVLETQGKGHYVGTVLAVRLRERRPRVTTMAHDRDKDWRVEPKLYR
jgi:hypothetical protein